MKRLTRFLAFLFVSMTLPVFSQDLPDPIVDNFNEANGSVSAWNFLGGGATGTLTNPDGTLQIFAPASSNSPGMAAMRKDTLFDDFVVEAAVLPDPKTDKVTEMVGLIARENGSGNFKAPDIDE